MYMDAEGLEHAGVRSVSHSCRVSALSLRRMSFKITSNFPPFSDRKCDWFPKLEIKATISLYLKEIASRNPYRQQSGGS